LPFLHTDCGAHLLNLAVKEGLTNKEDGPISQLIARIKKTVAHFKHSNKAFSEFKDIQENEGLICHTLLQVCNFLF